MARRRIPPTAPCPTDPFNWFDQPLHRHACCFTFGEHHVWHHPLKNGDETSVWNEPTRVFTLHVCECGEIAMEDLDWTEGQWEAGDPELASRSPRGLSANKAPRRGSQ